MKKLLRLISVVLLGVMLLGMTASAESTNYNNNTSYYSYTYTDHIVQTPAPYSVLRTIKGTDLGIADFNKLSDVYYDKESERIFLTDSGANTITVLDKEYRYITQLSGFQNNGVQDGFLEPASTCVRDGKLYVADKGNGRILRFDAQTFELQKVLAKPEIAILGEAYSYKPARIAIDLAGRIYCIATDINDGILLLDDNGEFIRFVAAPDVTTTLWTKFLKLFMTKAQKQNLEKAVPTEYSSMFMDEKGFLYLTSSDTTVHPITKVNSQGSDILNYEGQNYPAGDGWYKTVSGSQTSIFVDIAVQEDNIYAALDSERGRVFVYDQEGNLLYCFGGIGTQDGNFYVPSAMDMFDDTILVTDSFYGTLNIFKRTEFGSSVNEATVMMLEGRYDEAEKLWLNVLRMCPNYEMANLNLARVDIQNQKYASALKRLEGTSAMNYYSKAYEGVREAIISEHFTLIVVLLVVAVVLLLSWKFIKKRLRIGKKLERYKLIQEIKYSNYTMFHPFDGFWDLKHEKRGSVAAANVLVILFVITYALRVQFSGYVFTGVLPENVNTIYEIVKMVLPLGLWCVANWCFTSLMDGEGTMKDIYVASAYCLKPYIVTAIPLWLLSHCLSQDEAFIYTTLSSIVMVWMLGLLFFAMITTHDYSLGKGILVAILTLIGICLILFIALTFTNIIQRIYDFGLDLYREFIYRTY